MSLTAFGATSRMALGGLGCRAAPAGVAALRIDRSLLGVQTPW